jgi:hypothetical protein
MSVAFLESLDRIPPAQKRKVREFMRKFRADPKSNAINYEKLQGHRSPHVRTVRIDQKYRAVVLHPDAGDEYVLLWVDNHDEAMNWAKRRSFEVNPRTGTLQVYSVEEASRAVLSEADAGGKPGLLDGHRDDVLLSFGVPEVLLPAVRAVTEHESLLALGRHLPDEVAEALVWLAAGEPLDSVRAYLGGENGAGRGRSARTVEGSGFRLVAPSGLVRRRLGQRVAMGTDGSDLAAALRHPDSRRRFVTVQSDEELIAILDAPLEKWRVFLHPSQEKLVGKSFNGPARVTGGDGQDGRGNPPGAPSGPHALPLAAGPDPVHDLHEDPRREHRAESRPPLRPRGRPDRDRPPSRLGHAVPPRSGAEVRGRQPLRTGRLLGRGDPGLG